MKYDVIFFQISSYLHSVLLVALILDHSLLVHDDHMIRADQ